MSQKSRYSSIKVILKSLQFFAKDGCGGDINSLVLRLKALNAGILTIWETKRTAI